MDEQQKWYKTTWGITLLSIFAFPVGGYLLWKTSEGFYAAPEKKKFWLPVWGITFLVFIVVTQAKEKADASDRRNKAITLMEQNQIEGVLKMFTGKDRQDFIASNESYPDQFAKYYISLGEFEELTQLKLSAGVKIEAENAMIAKIEGYSKSYDDLDKAEKILSTLMVVSGNSEKSKAAEKAFVARKKVLELSKPALSSREAANYCKDSVEKRLKSPSSADFESNWFANSKMTRNDNQYTVYRYDSYVDAVNSFNAKLRTKFTCIATVTKGTGRVNLDVTIY